MACAIRIPLAKSRTVASATGWTGVPGEGASMTPPRMDPGASVIGTTVRFRSYPVTPASCCTSIRAEPSPIGEVTCPLSLPARTHPGGHSNVTTETAPSRGFGTSTRTPWGPALGTGRTKGPGRTTPGSVADTTGPPPRPTGAPHGPITKALLSTWMTGEEAGSKTRQKVYVAISESVSTPSPSPVTSAKKRADGVARKVRLDRASARGQSVDPTSIPAAEGPAGVEVMPEVPNDGRRTQTNLCQDPPRPAVDDRAPEEGCGRVHRA